MAKKEFTIVPPGRYTARTVEVKKPHKPRIMGSLYVRHEITEPPYTGCRSVGYLPPIEKLLEALRAMSGKHIQRAKDVKLSELKDSEVIIEIGHKRTDAGTFYFTCRVLPPDGVESEEA